MKPRWFALFLATRPCNRLTRSRRRGGSILRAAQGANYLACGYGLNEGSCSMLERRAHQGTYVSRSPDGLSHALQHARRLAGLAEGRHAVDADLFHRGAGRFEVLARIELLGVLRQHLAD